MQTLLQDVRYAVRLLARYPLFTGLALTTLALGIGVTTSIFSVINAVLVRPLPYTQPDRLVIIRARTQGDRTLASLASGEIHDLRDLTSTFSDVAALVVVNGDLTSRHNDQPMERVAAASVSTNLFSTLGVTMAFGRPLDPELDAGPGPIRGVVISHELWTRRFGGAPSLVGQTIEVNNLTLTVAGILPPGFTVVAGDDVGRPDRIDVWFPAAIGRDRASRGHVTYARLNPGVTVEQARAELSVLGGRLSATYPEAYSTAGLTLTAERLQDDVTRAVKPALMALGGAVMFLLLIACANVANLLVARTTSRAHELAIRTATGAGAGRLFRQLLTEGLLLGVAGGALGLLVAQWSDAVIRGLRPPTMPAVPLHSDWTVLAFAIGATLVTSLLFTIAPALQALRRDPIATLRTGGRMGSATGRRLRTTLVVVEVALAVVLLTGAGLMIRTAAALSRVDKGFDDADVLTLRVSMRPREFADFDKKWQFYRQALDQLGSIPNVGAVGAVRPLPLEGVTFTDQAIVGPANRTITVGSHTTLPGYFAAMGIRIVRGRDFTADDMTPARAVAMVDEQFARQAWPGEDPIGRRLAIGTGSRAAASLEVVGVVAHVHAAGLRDTGAPQLYLPYSRYPIFDMAFALKVRGDPNAIAATARDRIEALGGRRPVYLVRPMSEYVAEAGAEGRFVMLLLGGFASLALLLSLVGLYGVIADTTSQRTREIGIRVALGAHRRHIVRLVVGDGLVWTSTGIVVGTAAAVALTGSLRSLLFAVSPGDPLTLAVVAAVLLAVSMGATFAPVRRATRIAASVALRAE